jgi:hypothetical protein
MSTVKRYFSEVNRTTESLAENLNRKMEEIIDTQTLKDSELSNLDKVINDLQLDMGQYITKQETSKIWTYMQRFPLYEDIKDLNNKFLPELAKMEQHVANFQLEMDQVKMIVRRFDENIANKSGKESIDLIHEKIDKECALK